MDQVYKQCLSTLLQDDRKMSSLIEIIVFSWRMSGSGTKELLTFGVLYDN